MSYRNFKAEASHLTISQFTTLSIFFKRLNQMNLGPYACRTSE